MGKHKVFFSIRNVHFSPIEFTPIRLYACGNTHKKITRCAKTQRAIFLSTSRDSEIRTHDLLLPKQAF